MFIIRFQLFTVVIFLYLLCIAGCSNKPGLEFDPEKHVNPALPDIEPSNESVEYNYFKANSRFEPPAQSQDTAPSSSHPTIRVIGIDAVGWPLLTILLNQGKIPHIKKLISQGSAAILHTDVAESPVSWTTIGTGKQRNKHGIIASREGTQSAFAAVEEDIKVPRVWEILRNQGIPSKVGWYYFTREGDYGPNPFLFEYPDIEARLALKDYSFYITILETTDFWQHTSILQFMLLQTSWGKQFTIHKQWRAWSLKRVSQLYDTFSGIDNLVGEILRLYPQDTLILLSDHGMRLAPSMMRIGITNLAERVLPDRNRTKSSDGRTIIEPGLELSIKDEIRYSIFATHKQTHEKLYVKIITPLIHITDPSGQHKNDLELARKELLDISFEGTRLLKTTGDGSIRFDPRVIEAYLDGDINDFFKHKNDSTDPVDYGVSFGIHIEDDSGILIAYGPEIRAGVVAGPFELVDVTPTMLYLYGLPIGRDMDGSVAEGLIKPAVLAARPATFIDSYDDVVPLKRDAQTKFGLSPEELRLFKQSGYPGIP